MNFLVRKVLAGNLLTCMCPCYHSYDSMIILSRFAFWLAFHAQSENYIFYLIPFPGRWCSNHFSQFDWTKAVQTVHWRSLLFSSGISLILSFLHCSYQEVPWGCFYATSRLAYENMRASVCLFSVTFLALNLVAPMTCSPQFVWSNSVMEYWNLFCYQFSLSCGSLFWISTNSRNLNLYRRKSCSNSPSEDGQASVISFNFQGTLTLDQFQFCCTKCKNLLCTVVYFFVYSSWGMFEKEKEKYQI